MKFLNKLNKFNLMVIIIFIITIIINIILLSNNKKTQFIPTVTSMLPPDIGDRITKEQINHFIKNDFIVLLTMTIAPPKDMIYLNRTSIATRIDDYRKSLQQWALLPYKVVVVENSGYGNPFKDILKNSKNIRYFSVKTKQDPFKGKGYGEAQTIRHIIIRNIIHKFMQNNKVYLMKVTGRYSPAKNLDDVIKMILYYHPTAIVKYDDKNDIHHSEWLVSKINFLLQISNKCIASCDDNVGKYFEWSLMKISKKHNNVIYTDLNIEVLPTHTGTFNTYMDKI